MSLSDHVTITPPAHPMNASIRPPGSKSITNRSLVCAALATGKSCLHGVLDSDDTRVMLDAWRSAGLAIEHDRNAEQVTVEGCGGRLPTGSVDEDRTLRELFIGNSGTSIRFLTAALSVCRSGQFLLDGVPRMRARPIGDLLRALERLGAKVRSTNAEHPDCPPVAVEAEGWRGGETTVAGSISSQFLSGLMLAAPLADTDVVLRVDGELVSLPYVEMTRRVMQSFGAMLDGPTTGPLRISVQQAYRATDYVIEPDATAASYFWAAAAITGGVARVEGLSTDSLQGDVGFCRVLEQMGCRVEYLPDAIEIRGGPLNGIDIDMGEISDTVQTLAAVALFAQGPTTVRGVAHNRVKETDRITDLARELRKSGAMVEEFQDGLKIFPPETIRASNFETYDDHRMAMSLALIGLKASSVTISNPACTAKTYPRFWEDLQSFSGCGVH